MVDKLSDSWQTPDWLFKQLDEKFHFDIDLCATAANSKCDRWYEDYLTHNWREWNDSKTRIINHYGEPGVIAECAFMNPPYSNPKPFIEKAWEDSKHCKIVCLLPNTIKTCKYMDILDDNKGLSIFRKWKEGIEIRDLTRRTKFTHLTKESSSPSFGCMVMIMDRRNV